MRAEAARAAARSIAAHTQARIANVRAAFDRRVSSQVAAMDAEADALAATPALTMAEMASLERALAALAAELTGKPR